MTIVGGFDVHRKQITFDYVDSDSGEVRSVRSVRRHAQLLRALAGQALPRRGCGFCGGGLHRVAVRGRGAERGSGGARTSG